MPGVSTGCKISNLSGSSALNFGGQYEPLSQGSKSIFEAPSILNWMVLPPMPMLRLASAGISSIRRRRLLGSISTSVAHSDAAPHVGAAVQDIGATALSVPGLRSTVE